MVDYVKLDDDEPRNSKKQIIIPQRNWFTFKRVILLAIAFFFIVSFVSSLIYSFSPKIAVIPLDGVLVTGSTGSIWESSVSSRETVSYIEQARDDSSVKAIVLDINSPGGSPVASEEISKAIESVNHTKPVIAVISDIGASGAFWVAVSADKIYVSPMSIVGSIGVTSAGLSFEDFIKNYNITYRRLTSGKFKDMGTPYRNMSTEETKMFQQLLDEVHQDFIAHVAKSRNLSIEYVKPYAEGQIFLGSQAVKLKFADKLGYYTDVISDLKKGIW